MCYQILGISDHDRRRGKIHSFAALREKFVNERLVVIGGNRALAAAAGAGGGVQLGEQRIRYPLVLDGSALLELVDVVNDAIGSDDDAECH